MPPSETLLSRAQQVTRLDLRPRARRPSLAKVAQAGVVAVAASLVADLILVAIGKAMFHPHSFGPFHPSAYVSLTVLGVVGATIGWGILVHLSSEPRWFVLRAAGLVTLVLLIPDVALLPNNPTGPVIILMCMHVAIAVVTYWALLLVAPALGTPRSQPLTRR